MVDRVHGWCILRTSPSSTIALAEALTNAGIRAWTPVAKLTRDAMRAKEGLEPLPRGKGSTPMSVPILSTFVFAGWDQIGDLLRMADSPSLNYRVWDKVERRMVVRGRPHFTVFHIEDTVAFVDDRHLEPLREYERKAAERAAKARGRRGKRGRGAYRFALGDVVRVPEGPFAGLSGVVVPSQKNGSVRVEFHSGALTVEIEPWLVQAIDVEIEQPHAGTAAKAA